MCSRQKSKSVLCVIITLTHLWSTAGFYSSSVVRSKSGLPRKRDLNDYMESLKIATNYYAENKDNINVDVLFGLFLTNVNLGYTFNEGKLPKPIQSMILDVTSSNTKLMNDFLNRTKHETFLMPWPYGKIAKLYTNVTHWINRLEKFQNINQKSHTEKELQKIYPEWPKYFEQVDNTNDWKPNPEVSDMCLVSLSINANNKKKRLGWCPVDKECYDILQNGTDFGYAFCHRMLLLLMARLGRGCFIFSEYDDKQLLQKFCSIGYAEVEYIALNDFKMVDLMFEFMCICLLDGQSQYLRRSWLDQVLNHQTTNGCFSQFSSKAQIFDPWQIEQLRSRRQSYYEETKCTGHITALASGVLSSAVRFISEKYY